MKEKTIRKFIPILRRSVPLSIAEELSSVQPMNISPKELKKAWEQMEMMFSDKKIKKLL